MVSSNAITSQTSFHVKPSIFDLVAQDSMSDLLHPAFKKIIQYLSLKNPERYGWMVKWIDECFFAFNLCVQRFCLVHCGASFSEFVYKLQRVPASSISNTTRLPWKQEVLSLICLTLIPHLRLKAKEYANKNENPELLTNICRASLFLSSVSRLVHHVLYLTNRIESHSPLLTLCGLKLTYAPDELIHTNRFLAYLYTLIQTGGLSIQLLDTWVSTARDDVTLSHSKSIPPPPPPHSSVSLPPTGVCPLCRAVWRIPTVLATSGYVFCFKCIAERVQLNPQCPLTGIPSSIDDLIQIYAAS